MSDPICRRPRLLGNAQIAVVEHCERKYILIVTYLKIIVQSKVNKKLFPAYSRAIFDCGA